MVRLSGNILIIIVFAGIFLALSGCSSPPAVGPKETVDAFFKAIINGDTKGALEYVEGVDTRAIERLSKVREFGKTALEEFFSPSKSTLLEQKGETAKVEWQPDLIILLGGQASEETGGEKTEGGEVERKGQELLEEYLLLSKLEELTTTIFTLEIKNGKWKITKIEHPKSEGLSRRSRE